VVGTSDQETQYAAMRQIIEIARDEFWTMGVSLPAKSYAIVSDRIHNVPGDGKMWLAFKCPYPAVTNVSTYFIQES
jgi:peptide/nickel transport system substrate-binding protein